ncbi:MAG: 4Fe-4S dicluster domain-containing protein [Pseudomonadota bacterium]
MTETNANGPTENEQTNPEKWNLIIDVELGVDFINAVLSAKDEYVGNEHPGYSAALAEDNADIITLERKVRGAPPLVDAVNILHMCNHCDNGPCQKVGGDAVHKRDDGIVIIDPVKAKGRRDIVDACPHNAIVWNEDLQLPQHWTFDAHLLDQGWEKPRCVQSCAAGGIEAIKISDEDMQRRVQVENLEVLPAGTNTKPRVYYKNLYRYNRCFIAGTVVTNTGDVEDCLIGASVTLLRDGDSLQSTTTDSFGEFKLDKLEPGSGRYTVRIEHPGFSAAEIEAELDGESLNLGVHVLEANSQD